jgi:hypothetical protein
MGLLAEIKGGDSCDGGANGGGGGANGIAAFVAARSQEQVPEHQPALGRESDEGASGSTLPNWSTNTYTATAVPQPEKRLPRRGIRKTKK